MHTVDIAPAAVSCRPHQNTSTLRLQGQSRGYGFVHYTNAQDAKMAMDGMDKKTVDGKPLVVRLRSEGPGARQPRVNTMDIVPVGMGCGAYRRHGVWV